MTIRKGWARRRLFYVTIIDVRNRESDDEDGMACARNALAVIGASYDTIYQGGMG